MKEEINEDVVELAERYANALKQIKELVSEGLWDEDDVETAERYAVALEKIKKIEMTDEK
jgi:hypothetical protein